MNSKNIKYYLLTASAMAAFIAVSCFTTGILQLVLGIFVSVLLGLQTVKYHYGYICASSCLVFLVPLVLCTATGNAFGDSILYTALLTVPLILMGLTLGFSANLKISFFKTITILAVIYLSGSLINMKILSSANPGDFGIENIISLSTEQVLLTLQSAYAEQPELLEIVKNITGEISGMMLTLSPALFILISLLIGYISVMLFKNLLNRRQIDVSFWPSFSNYRADTLTGILFIVLFFISTAAPEGLFADALANVLLILSCIFFLFGLSYIDWKLRLSGVKPFARKMMFIALIPLSTSFFMMPFLIITIIGVSDSIINYREKFKQKLNRFDKQ